MCLLCVAMHNTKSMTEKIDGNNTGAVEAWVLCDRLTAQALPVCGLGGLFLLIVAPNAASLIIHLIRGCMK